MCKKCHGGGGNKELFFSDCQKRKIKEFWNKYDSKTDDLFHRFYYKSTGIFDVKYIPDDLYYTKIDPFYNRWDEARFIDNKTYYDMIFYNVRQPQTIVMRSGEIWKKTAMR